MPDGVVPRFLEMELSIDLELFELIILLLQPSLVII